MDFTKIKTYLGKINFAFVLLGIVVGGIGGYIYYYFIGCSSGSCPITSNPVNSILYGMLFGGILFFKERKQAENDANEKSNQ